MIHGAREHEQQVGQPIEIMNDGPIDLLIAREGHDRALGAPARRARQVQRRGFGSAAGKDEVLQGGERGFATRRVLGLFGASAALVALLAWVEARHEATRNACISQQLVQRAESNLQTLEATGVAGVVRYAQAYLQHAQFRASAAAQADSAANFSPQPGDSARHAQAAARHVVSRPEPGSVDANVNAQYEREFAEIRTNPDHPCNWNFQELDSKGDASR